MTARVLVLDGTPPAAVVVVRSLVAAGHRVHVLAEDRHAPAAAVRGRSGRHPVPDPATDPAGWRDAVSRIAGRFDVLLPVSDVTQVLLATIAGDLPSGTTAALPVPSDLDALHDKVRVLERAAALGIPVLARTTGDTIATVALPAVLKPRRSRVVGADGARGATARIFADAEELARAARALVDRGLGAYAEPWRAGGGHGVFLLMDHGRVLARFAHRRIREASPMGGPSAVCESTAPDAELEARAVALAKDLGVTGPFMAEFRGEGSDHVLLEVNVRYWGSLGLAVDAGVDFPALHVAALTGRPVPGPATWRIGLRRRNLAFDLKYAATVLFGRPRGHPLPWPGRWETVHRAFVEDSRGLIYRRSDPAPGREHLLRLVRKAFHG